MKRIIFIIVFFSQIVFGQKKLPYQNANIPIEERVSDLLMQMTLEEKVNQLVSCSPVYTIDKNGQFVFNKDFQNKLKGGIGSLQYVNTPLNAVSDVLLVNQIQRHAIENSRLGIPLLIEGEALHGLVAYQATSYPQAIAIAATWDTSLVCNVYTRIALEARTRGINLAFSPLLDLSRDPRWGRMEETYGEDVYLVSQIGMAAITGFQGGGVTVGKDHIISSPKHFAGYGQCEGGRNFAPTNIPERLFLEEILESFRQAVTKGHIWGIMPSHSEIDGVPCHSNEHLLTDILRKEWGFKGIVVSDYFDIQRLNILHHVAANDEEAALLALKAGVNLEQPIGACYETLKETLRNRPEFIKYLDERVKEVLRVKFMLGLFENPYGDEQRAKSVSEDKTNKELALKTAEKAVILLKNENNILPLDKAKVKKIAVIGPNADNVILGGYSPKRYQAVSILEGLKEYLKGTDVQCQFTEGCGITKEKAASQFETVNVNSGTSHTIPYKEEMLKIAEAAQLAKQSDVAIVCVGDNYLSTREAIFTKGNLGDRANLDLVGNQNALVQAIVETGTPVIVVLIHGRSLTINYIAEKAKGIIDGWYLGEQTGTAIARTLFGENNPGGKLPVTVPRNVGQLPVYYSQRESGTLKDYLFEDCSPLYPFGFGLSYTQFSLENIVLSRNSIKVGESCEVTLDVRNIGMMSGDEVVQVYVKDVVGSVSRPKMQLKAFNRVTIAAGESQKVKLTLGKEAFEMIDLNYKRVIEPGEFKIYVGTSSQKKDLTELSLLVH